MNELPLQQVFTWNEWIRVLAYVVMYGLAPLTIIYGIYRWIKELK
jgi:thiosulfate reductase cytochrome b subunit